VGTVEASLSSSEYHVTLRFGVHRRDGRPPVALPVECGPR
jgi:hypothetical protein